jgi:hypothetical protein
MASILKKRLRIRAAEHGPLNGGRRMGYSRGGLESKYQTGADPWRAIRAIVDPIGGIELDISPRKPMREPPDFSARRFGSDMED